MTRQGNVNVLEEVMELIYENGLERLDQAISIRVNHAMKIERAKVLKAAPYERTIDRRGYSNGFKDKKVKSRIGALHLKIPRVRGDVAFYPTAVERGERSERALKPAIAEMYLKGVSTRKVRAVMEKLCGFDVTSTPVSRATQELDEVLEYWRNRELGRIAFVQLDASYEKVRVDGSVRSCAVLIATGVNTDGKRMIPGVSVSVSEAEIHWRDFLLSLKNRGLHGINMVTSDDHSGLKAALQAAFPGASRQRCQVHLQRNASQYVPKKYMKEIVAKDIRMIFNAPDKKEAERRRLRPTNMVERIHKEVNRRTRVATLFPNEAALLRLVSAILMEISEEWECGKKYLTLEKNQIQ